MANDFEVILSDDEILDDGLSVSTDLDDYAPGSTAEITATGVAVGGTVTFEIDHVSGPGEDGVYGTADDTIVELGGDGHDSWTVTDGGAGDLDGEANGTVVTSWYVNPDDSLDETFLLSADDGVNTAYYSFTDSHIDGVGTAAGADIDLTIDGNIKELSGAIFSTDADGAGTGVINSFVRINTNNLVEEGYNTSDRPLDFDENSSPIYTRDLFFGDIPVITLYDEAGIATEYLEFQLDINEPNNYPGSYLSLDEIEIYMSDAQVPVGNYNSVGDGGFDSSLEIVKAWELDSDGDYWIALDYGLESGSGVSDMVMYVPLSYFDGAEDDTYITLYSQFGEEGETIEGGEIIADWSNNGGFEEWSVRQFAEVIGLKFNDYGSDGAQGDGDEPMGGWEIRAYVDIDRDGLLDQDEYNYGAYATTITDESGEFELNFFLNAQVPNSDLVIEDAQYLIVEVMQEGWEQSAPGGSTILDAGLSTDEGDVLGPNGYIFDPTSSDLNETLPGYDFGNYEPFGSITGVKYDDLNGDGDAGSNTEISGWTVYLFNTSIDTSGDGSLNQTELDAALASATPVDTATTDAGGVYLFEQVDVGEYFVVEDIDGPDGSWEATTTPWHAVTVVGGETYGDEGGEATDFYNFENFDISGRKYEDMDGDGDVTDGDGGWGDVTIQLVDGDGIVVASTTTNANAGIDANGDGFANADDVGYWEFTDLNFTVDGYTVREVQPDGSYLTLGGTNVDDSYTIVGTSGNDQEDLDFANTKYGQIEGYKFFDVTPDGTWDFVDSNGNGTWDPGEEGDSKEVGAVGWTIELYQETDGTPGLTAGDGAPIQTTYSDENGFWTFDGLEMGTYYVKEVLKAGWLQTTPAYEGDGIFKVVVDESGEVVIEAVSADPTSWDPLKNDGMLWFGNDMIEGPGVRTPGFWQSDLGQTYWDGFDNNDGVIPGTGNTEEKEGDEFAENDLFELNYPNYFNGVTNPDDPQNPGDINFTPPADTEDAYPTTGNASDGYSPDLLVGDWNFDTLKNDGETILDYSLEEAVIALQGGEKTKGKSTDYAKVSTVERSLVASWLNYMAGNSVETEVEGETIGYWIDQAILYVDKYETGNNRKAGKEAWSKDTAGIEAGSEIQTVLDGWNNYGIFSGEQITFDADDGADITSQAYYDAIA